ncbi:MAG: hypothetical protein J7J36_07075, partial [Thermoplasmata archaeon]|nr:hypothetical protein [Thermoplasmata archaeon]
AREVFDEELYRKFRGIIEEVFGGLEIRRLLFTRYRKETMRMKHIIAMAIVHHNIGLIGVSNGGNIVIAAPAIYGKEMKGYLRYVIQWNLLC